MKSIASRTAILGFSRIANQGLTLVTPLFLVRLLTVEQFGEYREFLLYVSVLGPIAAFHINNSLLYFVPKNIKWHRRYVTQAAVMMLGSSTVVIILAWAIALGNLSVAVQDSMLLVLCYVFFATNLDFWETYWLSRKQSFNVLAYSTGRLAVRAATVLLTAFLTRNVSTMILALVIVEIGRFIVFGIVALKLGLLSGGIDRHSFAQQAKFAIPVGIAGMLLMANSFAGQIFVSFTLGAATLAYYVVGTTLQPVISVFRNAVADVILPEIMSRTHDSPESSLRLWQKASVFYCLILMPIAVVGFCISDPLVTTLFTDAYRPAVPVFEIYLLVLIRECFDFGVPLRVAARTTKFVIGNLIALFVNLPLIFLLANKFGLIAPAIAFVIARFVNGLYLTYAVVTSYDISIRKLLPWIDILKIASASILAAITYVLIAPLGTITLLEIAYFLAAYLVMYLALVWGFDVSVAQIIIASIRQRILTN